MSKNNENVSAGFKPSGKQTTILLLIAICIAIGAIIFITAGLGTGKDSELSLPETQKKTADEIVMDQAREFLAKGQVQGAVDVMRDFVNQNPSDTNVRANLAELYMTLGQAELVKGQADAILEISPDDPRGLWFRGVLVNSEGGNAEEYFRRAAVQPEAGPGIWGMYGIWLVDRKKDVKLGRMYLEKSVAAGSQDPNVYMALGNLAFNADKYEKSIGYLKTAIRLNPTDPVPYGMLADVLKNTGRPVQAMASLEQGLRFAKGPIRGDILMQLGMARVICKQWPEAAEVFEQATQYSHVRPRAYMYAASSRYFAEQFAQAKKNIDLAWQLTPHDPDILQWRERIYQAQPGAKKSTVPIKPSSLFDSLPKTAEKKEDADIFLP